MQAKHRGFLMVELMVVLSIVTMLVAMGVPTYQRYTRRAAALELLQKVMPVKLEVELASLEQGRPTGDGLQNEAEDFDQAVGGTATPQRSGRVNIAADGVITAEGHGPLEGLQVQLTPKLYRGYVAWDLTCSAPDSDLKRSVERVFQPALNSEQL